MPPTLNPSLGSSTAARGTAVFLVLFAIVLLLAWGGLSQTVPPLDGRAVLSGLRANVDVRFDPYAIPHVYAGSDEDAWRAVGYLQARDRLWQMELYRRAASGRLSELLGEGTIVIDQRFITLGLRQAAEGEWKRTPPHVRAALEQYAAGVNAVISGGWIRHPLEFQVLRVRPEVWTPIDTLAIGKLFAWRLGENHNAELLRYSLVQTVGPRALELFPEPPEWAPTILNLPSEGAPAAHARSTRAASVPTAAASANPGSPAVTASAAKPGLEWLFAESPALSNSWVIHGSRTASGRPLLANDPHLVIEMPSVWWEVHIVSPALDVAGVTIPGVPFVLIGHNRRVAWGLTNVGADVQDFYVEQVDAARNRYRVGEEWRPLDVRRHDIRVRGRAEPVRFEVRATRHGPVLNAESWREPLVGTRPDAAPLNETVLALRWHRIHESESAAAFDRIGRADNWQEFVEGVRQFSAPSQNFVYADVDGNIGYAMSGLLPLRNGADGSVPQRGSDTEDRGQASIPPAELPAVLNPPQGLIVSANNEVDRGLPHSITHDWVAPFRAQRIVQLLGDRRGHDLQEMQRLQTDITSLSADWLLTNMQIPPSVGELQIWDRRVDDRPESLVYEAFEEALWRRTFADEMPAPMFDRFYRYAGNERFAGLRAIISDPNSSWFDDRLTPDVIERRDDIAKQAGEDAIQSLRARFGDRSNWRWSEIHGLRFTHVLSGGGRILDWFFSRGPVPVAGNNMTVNKTTTNLRRPYETSEAASYRQILDVGAWDQSLGVNTAGQSGHPRSPHYFDQNALWRRGRYRALPFTRQAVEKATASRLQLVP